MKRIVWPCLLCILAGCAQTDPGDSAGLSEQTEPLRADHEKTKAVGSSADDAIKLVMVIAVPEGGKPVVARADAEGTIHLLYNSADGPKYAKSSDNGKTFEASIPVVDEGSRKPGLVFEGWDMAVGKGNRVHLAMGTNAWKLKLAEKEWAFLLHEPRPRSESLCAGAEHQQHAK